MTSLPLLELWLQTLLLVVLKTPLEKNPERMSKGYLKETKTKHQSLNCDTKKDFLPILLLVVWTTSVSSAVCCLSRCRYFSAKYLKTK